ncbi:MAG: hypothetical protein R3342_01420 [Lutibacter sp.]|uniref:hypothetical protein n=1 Tax=Lutibacter sp. TaxID=1925666 RepID=UPI00299CD7BA|nr:hypothetical protein [Lutibacter sp.]MDX1828180.1 hypothetical protein [Lutibacter sp.]
MIDKTKIAILTTVANFELYKKTSQFFPKDIKRYVIDGRKGMYGIHSIKYMMKKLKGKGIEWLVMADEDVVFTKSDKIFTLINEMKKENITVCGVRDGGVIPHRKQNPWTINTFFSILSYKEIEAIWNEKEVLKNQYVLENEFDDNLSNLINEFDIKSIYEPYYCFYFWLRRSGKKILFLDAKICNDEISNSVLFKDEIFLYHTWYARSYGVNEMHTKRIDSVINLIKTNGKNENFTIFIDNFFVVKKKFKALKNRVFKKIN